MKVVPRLLRTVCALIAVSVTCSAATLTWVGGTGDWSIPGNWDGGTVPGPTDVAVINSGDVTADWESTIVGLTITGGTLRGVGIIHITGIYNLTGGLDWRGGMMTGIGQTILDAQGTGAVNGLADKILERRLDNGGAITWDQGKILFRNGTLNNLGVMTIAHETDLQDIGGGGVFENSGTLHKVGVGTVHFRGVVFNQTGTLDFAGGTLWLSGGGQNAKTINVPAGGQLRIDNDYLLAVGSTLTGAGDVSFENRTQSIQGAYTVGGVTAISGGTVAFETEATVPQLQLSSGTLQGAGVVHLTGSFNWTGGTMSGTGRTIIESGGTAVWTGAEKDLLRALDNGGAITWDQGKIFFRNGTLNNLGVMTIAHETDLQDIGGGGVFENSGTLHKVGAGIVHFRGVVFNQSGTLDFAGGTLWLSGGGQNAKTINVPAGRQLRIDSDYLLAAGSTLTGAGDVSFENGAQSVQGGYSVGGITSISGATVSFEAEATLSQLQLSNGRLQGAGLVHVTGTFNWTAGAMSGAGRTVIESGATAQWSGGSDKDLERALENKGAIRWDQARIVFRGAGALINSGVMTIVHDGELFNGGGSAVLENTGALNKTSAGILFISGVFFNQKGIVNAVGTIKPTAGQVEQHGTINPGLNIGALTWNGDLPQSADGTLRVEISGENNYDQINATGNAVLRGTLKVELTGGFVPADGASFTVMQFASRTGAFDSIAGLNVSNELFLEPIFTTTNLVLTVHAKPRPIFTNSRVDKTSRLPVFSISNIAGQTFILEARDSFEPGTAWQDILTNPDSSVDYDFVDNDRANHPTRFFRVRLAP